MLPLPYVLPSLKPRFGSAPVSRPGLPGGSSALRSCPFRCWCIGGEAGSPRSPSSKQRSRCCRGRDASSWVSVPSPRDRCRCPFSGRIGSASRGRCHASLHGQRRTWKGPACVPRDEEHVLQVSLNRTCTRKQCICKGVPDRSNAKLVPAFPFLEKRQNSKRSVSGIRVMINPRKK